MGLLQTGSMPNFLYSAAASGVFKNCTQASAASACFAALWMPAENTMVYSISAGSGPSY